MGRRKEECSVVSVVLVQRMERLVTFVAIFGGSGFFTCSDKERKGGALSTRFVTSMSLLVDTRMRGLSALLGRLSDMGGKLCTTQLPPGLSTIATGLEKSKVPHS